MDIISKVRGYFRLHPDAARGLRSRVLRSFVAVSAVLLAIPANQGLLQRFWDTSIGGHSIAGITLPAGAAVVSLVMGFIGANRGDPRNTYLTGGADTTNPLPAVSSAQAQAEVAAGGTSGPVRPGVVPDDLLDEGYPGGA